MRSSVVSEIPRSQRVEGHCAVSSDYGEDILDLRQRFAMFQPFSQYTKRKSLSLPKRLVPGSAIAHHARQIGNFSEPSAIIFLFDLD